MFDKEPHILFKERPQKHLKQTGRYQTDKHTFDDGSIITSRIFDQIGSVNDTKQKRKNRKRPSSKKKFTLDLPTVL